MTAKEYLEQVEGIEFRIKALAMQERRLRNRQGNEQSLQELRELIQELEEKYIGIQKKVTKEIDSMKNHVYAAILSARYLSNATWGEIAQLLDYKDEKYIRTTLHSKALKDFAKLTR